MISSPLTSSDRGGSVEYTQLQEEQVCLMVESHEDDYHMLDLVFLHAIQGCRALHVYHSQNGDGGHCRDFQETMVDTDSYTTTENWTCGMIQKRIRQACLNAACVRG